MKMKYTALRRYMKGKNNLSSPHSLEDCDLVIDGNSFFRDAYLKSGCQFILGPDCDRYADFLIKKLSVFLENNIKCYVIFSGATKHELEKRREIHQQIVGNRIYIENYRLVNAEYFPPLFVKDVQKQVLEEMNIKYFVCEYYSVEAIVGVARKLKCPVLTYNIEYCFFGVSCIPPNSVDSEKTEPALMCTIYDQATVKNAIGVYNKMPILLALLNESEQYFDKLTQIITSGENDMLQPVIRWVKRQREAVLLDTITKSFEDEDEKNAFMEVYEKIKTLYLYPSCTLAVKYFQRDRPHGLFKDDKKWFAKGVSNGRIALPYINLKKKGIISGSSLMYCTQQPDALLAAIDIITYSHCLLTNSQNSTITFVGRERNSSLISEIATYLDHEISNRGIFTKHRIGNKLKLIIPQLDPFEDFLERTLPGFKYNQPLLSVPEDCLILVLTLVYYIFKKNSDFINAAYCILLSYVMLGPVSEKLDLLKKDDGSILVANNKQDYVKFYNDLQFLFNRIDVEQKYDSKLVHSFSEFQHCLQHMNYLNKLCGGTRPCTIYHDTYNATFVYNTFIFMKNKDHLMTFLNSKFQGSKMLKLYDDIVTGFENCLSSVKVFAKNKSLAINKSSQPIEEDGWTLVC